MANTQSNLSWHKLIVILVILVYNIHIANIKERRLIKHGICSTK